MHPSAVTILVVLAGIAGIFVSKLNHPEPAVLEKPGITSVTSATGSAAVLALTDFMPEATVEEKRLLAGHFAEQPLEAPYDEAVAVLLTPAPVATATDPVTAVSLGPILAIEDPGEREKAVYEFLRDLDVSDPAALAQAAAAYAELPGTVNRSRVFVRLAKRVIDHDPDAARRWADQLPAGNVRDVAMGLATVALSRDDPDALFRYLDGIGWKTDFSTEFERRLVRLPSDDHRLARNYDQLSGSSQVFDDAISAALIQMVDAGDPVGALLQALKIPNSNAGRNASNAAFDHWFSQDTDAALSLLEGLGKSGSIPNFAQEALSRAATKDPEQATNLLEKLTNPDVRLAVGQHITDPLAKSDPDFAATWWAGLPSPEQAAFQKSLSWYLAQMHPEKSASLAQQVPGLFVDPETFGMITERWSESDPLAASEWVASLETGATRDGAVVSLVGTLTGGDSRDLEAATRWAETIDDPALRRDTLGKIPESQIKAP